MKKTIVSLTLAAAAFVAMAGTASAHHPELQAKAECVNGAFNITVDVEAWDTPEADRRHNNGISVQLMRNDRVLVAFGGKFTADNDYRFSGTFTSHPAGTYQVRAISTRPWGKNEDLGSQLESRTVTVKTPDVPCGGEYDAPRPLPTIAKPVVEVVAQPEIGTPQVIERQVAAEVVEAPVTPQVLAFTGRTTNTLLGLAAALMFIGAMTLLSGGKIKR